MIRTDASRDDLVDEFDDDDALRVPLVHEIFQDDLAVDEDQDDGFDQFDPHEGRRHPV